MTNPSHKELAKAKQCQLLTGSLEGDEMCCPCEGPAECHFSSQRRELLKDHPEVVARTKANKERYDLENNTTD